jgi:hypothetical protein
MLTLHGSRGHIRGRAEDESEGGLAVQVPDQGDWEIGQTVLVHRMHEQKLWMGTIRYLNPASDGGVRMGIELVPDSVDEQHPLASSVFWSQEARS